MNRLNFRLVVLFCIVLLMGCASDQEKTEKFLTQAQSAYDSGEYNQAVIQIKNAIETDQNSIPAHELLTKTYLKLGDARQAFDTLLKLEQLDPDDLDKIAQVASFYLLSQQKEEAEKRVDRILKEKPDHIQALYLRAGLLSTKKENLNQITDIYNTILSIDPNQTRALMALSRIYASQNDFEKAEQSLGQALKIEPDNNNIYKTLFEFYRAQNRVEDALGTLKNLISQKPDQAEPYIFLGNFHMGRNNLEKAKQAFLTAIEKDKNTVTPYMLLARVFNAQKSPDQAEAYIQQAISMAPDNTALKNAYAEFHFSHNDLERAQQMVDEILGKRPDFLPAKMLKGKILTQQKDYDGAIHLFTELIREEPDSATYYNLLGSVQFEKGELAQAKSSLSKALEKNPGLGQAQMLMATIHFRQKDLDLAQDTVRNVLKNQPGHYNANVLMGNILMAKRQNNQAREIFEQMIKNAPANPTAHYRLGILNRAEKKYDPAIANLTRALELNPNLMDVFSSLIAIYAVQGNFDLAIETCDIHMEKSKKSPTGKNPIVAAIILNLKGNLLLSKGDMDEALTAYGNSIEKNPQYISPYLTLAKLYASKKDWDKTEATYLSLIEKRPGLALPHGLLGTLYEKNGKSDLAETHYLKALEINPAHLPAVNNLAYLYAQENRELNRALELARQAKEKLGRIPAIMDTLGWVYYKKELYDSAASEFESCVELEPGNPIFHYHLGLAFHQLGKNKKAKLSLAKALELNKDFNGSEDAKKILKTL